jgi:arylsulfatase A-like enzyme
MRKGRYKLIDYMGYPHYRVRHRLEMYDLQNDPEELTNIYSDTMSAAWTMREELLGRIERADAKFVK